MSQEITVDQALTLIHHAMRKGWLADAEHLCHEVLKKEPAHAQVGALLASFGPWAEGVRLHIGGRVRRHGWTVVDIEQRPEVDVIGSCCDLSAFADRSVAVIYASHVLEHLNGNELRVALAEMRRVLILGGELLVAVPDFARLAQAFGDPRLGEAERRTLMGMVYGNHEFPGGGHKTGFYFPILKDLLVSAGFVDAERVEDFRLFRDASNSSTAFGLSLSLNMKARNP